MNYQTAISHLKALGCEINGGYIISDGFRFGRIGEDSLFTDDDRCPVIPIESISAFQIIDEGSFGIHLIVQMNDGSTIKPKRSELPPKNHVFIKEMRLKGTDPIIDL